ncbi:MAG: tetratricopeptide repeat protein [Acidobacteriia bacterium]|nr:tetratricopeptide repeat protein [Terriglobia bacterium]
MSFPATRTSFLPDAHAPTEAPAVLSYSRAIIFGLVLLLFCSGAARPAGAQQAAAAPSESADEFQRRLKEAMEARKTGDPAAIGRASERVIAAGLAGIASIRLNEKAYEEAAQLCRESMEYEDTAETRVELAIIGFKTKKTKEALKQAAAAIEKDPRNALAWNIKGEALLQNKDYGGGAEALERSLELHRDAESHYALGIAYAGLGEQQKAAESFRQMLELTGEHGWSRVLLGRAYQERQLNEEAEREFRTALRLDPGTPNANYFWAITLLQANEWNPTEEGKAHLREELRLNPRHFLATYLLGFFATNEKNFAEAEKYLHLAAELNPSLPDVWLYLGLSAQGRGDGASAQADFRKAIALAARSGGAEEHLAVRKAYFGLGRMMLAAGKRKEGEELLQKARELQLIEQAATQRKVAAMNARSGAGVGGAVVPCLPEAEEKNVFSAAPPAARSLRKPAGDAEKNLREILGASFNDLATAEALEEKYGLAYRHYREAERWVPRMPGLRRNLGLAAYFSGEHAQAIRLLSIVLQQTPGDEQARGLLGLEYWETGDFASAVKTLRPMPAHALQDAQLGYAWASSLAQAGNGKEAAGALERYEKSATNLRTEDRLRAGKLWEELGATERALNSFRQALLADPENGPAQLEAAAKENPGSLALHLALEEALRKAGRVEEADRQHALAEALRKRLPEERKLRKDAPPR